MDAVTAGGSTNTCPECGARLHEDPGFTVWCDRCDWNVDPYAPATSEPTRLERIEHELARRYGERLFAEIEKGVPLRPHRDATSVVVQVLALLVHASTVVLVAVGLWFVFGGLGIVLLFIGLVMLGIAVVLRPRFGRLPEYVPLLDRSEAPELFGLVDEIAAAARTRSADRIVIDGDFNASVTVYGVRGRRLLTIGLPLWEILSPAERVALLGHEFGHFSNGDLRYGALVQSAIRSVTAWCYLLEPAEYEGNPIEMVVNIFTFVPYMLFLGLLLLMYRLTLRSSQRGEYLADRLGARVGGTTAAISLQDRTLLAPFVERALVRVRSRMRRADPPQGVDGLWDGVAKEVATVPQRELERLRRAAAKRGQAVDETHPPTNLRREALARASFTPPEVIVDRFRAAGIETELATARREVALTLDQES